MDFFVKLAKSEAGQQMMNAVGQQVTAAVRNRVDERMSSAVLVPTQAPAASTSSAEDVVVLKLDDVLESAGTENPFLKWPEPIDATLPYKVHTIVSPVFALAEYSNGHAVVHRPSATVVYFNDSSARLNDISVLWSVFSEEIRKCDKPLPVIHDVVLMALNDKEKSSECKPLYFAILAGFMDYCLQIYMEEKKNKRFFTQPINKNGDNPALVAARSGNVELLRLFWDSSYPVYEQNKNGETVYMCGSKHPEIMAFINEKVSSTVLDEFIYIKAFSTGISSDADSLPVLRANYETKRTSKYMRLSLNKLIGVLSKGKASVDDIEKLLKEAYVQYPNFLGVMVNKQNIFHKLNDIPAQYHRLLIKFATVDMLNLEDENFETPLHFAARHKNYATFVSLWSFGADLSAQECIGGYPMDVALASGAIDIVKACIVFDAPYTKEILRRVMRDGSKNPCKEFLIGHYNKYKESCGTAINYDFNLPTHRRCREFPSITETDTVALCIDGGGMKGILALQVLKEIEKVKGGSFVSWFNHISGTSTGSIIALGLVKYNNIDSVLRAYFRLKDDVFVGSRPYSGDGLEAALLKEFGDLTLNELGEQKDVRISIPVARVDVSPPALCMFRNYTFKNDKEVEQLNWTAAKIARASSAAPSFFPPVDQKYMDGGLISNNPTIDVLADCQRLAFDAENRSMSKIVVSIGTGSLTKKCDNLDLAKPTTVSGILNTVNQILHLKDVFIDQITAADGVTVERAKWMAEAMGMAYFRFSPNLEFPVAIDEKSNVALIDAMLAVKYDTMSMRNDMLMLSSILQ